LFAQRADMTFWHLLIHRLDSDFFTHAIRACRASADFLVRSEAWRAAARNWDVPMAAVGAHSLSATSREVRPGRMAEMHANIGALPRGGYLQRSLHFRRTEERSMLGAPRLQ
jgi:hypothetical protein